jgi:CspA family cold shock protein
VRVLDARIRDDAIENFGAPYEQLAPFRASFHENAVPDRVLLAQRTSLSLVEPVAPANLDDSNRLTRKPVRQASANEDHHGGGEARVDQRISTWTSKRLNHISERVILTICTAFVEYVLARSTAVLQHTEHCRSGCRCMLAGRPRIQHLLCGSARRQRVTGKIRTLRVDKGFGFIKDDTGKEYFFHQSAVYGEGLENLREGDSVEFDVGEGPKGPRAENVRRTST